jgi:hypothetical protein
MPDVITVNEWPKATTQKEEVEKVRKWRLEHEGAKSCELSEDDSNWILTTVWPSNGQ